ncbi:DUF305 domain-containing protein [Sinomonas notoginsengisoli]|uniref:DUF305 domain-containing protein n=1 Tax=Sinomonas notoginsengisoli TaxID=1457311 RepID=UPI001F183E4B|nr:DUF305 domain-containing protein [Sinomonas notoginsengisoli]
MNLKTFALPSVAIAAILALAGCSGTAQSTTRPDGSGDHSGHSMPMGAPSASSAQGVFNAADAMFAQMMIPHHEQAVEMSGIVLSKPGLDARVAALAEQIKAAQAPEIATQRGWLAAWGQPTAMAAAAGHGMEGMMTADDLGGLKAAGASDAAKLFLTRMIAHHEGAVTMARTELSSGSNPEAVSMATSIIGSQTQEIEQMKSLLGQL